MTAQIILPSSSEDDLLGVLASLEDEPEHDAAEIPAALTAVLGDPATWRWEASAVAAAHAC
jgi:hypothetical protein